MAIVTAVNHDFLAQKEDQNLSKEKPGLDSHKWTKVQTSTNQWYIATYDLATS